MFYLEITYPQNVFFNQITLALKQKFELMSPAKRIIIVWTPRKDGQGSSSKQA